MTWVHARYTVSSIPYGIRSHYCSNGPIISCVELPFICQVLGNGTSTTRTNYTPTRPSSRPYYVELNNYFLENADSRRNDANDFCLKIKYPNFGSPSHRIAFVLRLHCVPAAFPGRPYGDPAAFLGCLLRPYCDHCVRTATTLRPYH